MNNKIIDKKRLKQKTRRLAYEILEEYYDQNELVLIAINGAGKTYATYIKNELKELSQLNIETAIIDINKKMPLDHPITLSIPAENLNDKHVVLIDDVANTGKTLFYALSRLVDISLATLKVAVLVDRKHKKFPVCADFVGTTLNTTINEHIKVVIENNTIEGVYLI